MKGSRKSSEPTEFEDWLNLANSEWRPSYGDLSGNVRKSVVDALYAEQRGLCVYCGRKLDLSEMGKTAHVEHFRPQSVYPYHQLTFWNLYLSCGLEDGAGNPSGICGNKKGSDFDLIEHVFPQYPACSERYNFDLNGNIAPIDQADTAAITMIKLLGLDHPELTREREEFLFFLEQEDLSLGDLFDHNSGTADGLAHVAYRRARSTLP